MKNITVMIAEDDFRVAEINKQYTEEVSGYTVVKIAKNGSEALSYIESNHVDLIILDIYLPDIYGIEILKEIRKKAISADVILITAAHDKDTVENSIRFGAFDYIIKPFNYERYRDALLKYRKFKLSLDKKSSYNQEELNEFISYNNSRTKECNFPKGITLFTLNKIKKAIKICDVTFTIREIMSKVELSRITVRRYLEFLCESNILRKSFKYKKIGRPTIIYSKK